MTQPGAAGYLAVYPDGGTRSTVSNGSGGTVQVLADVSGYFPSG